MYDQKVKQLLQQVSLFKELTNDDLNKLLGIARSRKTAKGSHIFLQGEPIEYVYFILSGKVKVYKNDVQGREQIVSVLKNGDMFPHVGFFRKGNYPAFAQAAEDSEIVAISIAHFEHLLLDNPEVSIKLFRVMGEKIIDLQNRLEAQILNNTYQQIIKLLLRLAEEHGTPSLQEGRITIPPFTNQEMANMIGTTRETMNRTLAKLKKKLAVELDSENCLVLHLALLEEELD